jgi:hypothetical protein
VAELVYCTIRKEWVALLPEEEVRQRLIKLMVEQLGYPISLLVVEKSLKQMPHLSRGERKLPERRADLLCYAPGIHKEHALYPLLLIECKAVKLTSKVISQVLGYNIYLQACFVAIANQEEIKTGWFDPATKQYRFAQGLPAYEVLCKGLKSN